MICILVLLCLIMSFINVAGYYGKLKGLKCILLSLMTFFGCYIICAGLFFWADSFTISKNLYTILMIQGIVFLLICLRKGLFARGRGSIINRIHRLKWCEIIWKKEGLVPLIIIIALALPFVYQKFDYYGMAQDEGAYQTQTLAFVGGQYENHKDLEEFELMDEKMQEEYTSLIQKYTKILGTSEFLGYYLDGMFLEEGTKGDEPLSPVSGYLHGYPTFASLLALWSTFFGYAHMVGIQTLFYIIFLVFLYLMMQKLTKSGVLTYAPVVIAAFCPQIIWTAKATLTEMFFADLIIAFVYLISEKATEKNILMSSFTLCALCFFHISFYTYLPAFLIIYFILFWKSRKREYVWAVWMMMLSFILSTGMSVTIAKAYSIGQNYTPIYNILSFVNQQNVAVVLIVFSVCVMILMLLLWIFFGWLQSKLTFTWKYWSLVKHILIRIVFLAPMIVLAVVFYRDYAGEYETAMKQMALFGYYFSTGYIMLPIVFILLMIFPSCCCRFPKNISVAILFWYTILVYCAFFRTEIPHYYYYGRYLVPWVAVILCLFMILVDKVPIKAIRYALVLGSLVVSLKVFLPYDQILLKSQDDSYVKWDVIEDLTEQLTDSDSVLLIDGYNNLRCLYFPLQYLTPVKVVATEDYEDLLEKLAFFRDKKMRVFYMSDNSDCVNHGDLVYYKTDTAYEDRGDIREGTLPLPTDVTEIPMRYLLYEVQDYKYEYDFGDADIDRYLSNFRYPEGKKDIKYRFTTAAAGTLYPILKCQDYVLVIQKAHAISLETLGWTSQKVVITLNGAVIAERDENYDNMEEQWVIELPSEMIKEGRNELSFSSPTWKAEDGTLLGTPVSYVLFKPALQDITQLLEYHYEYNFGDPSLSQYMTNFGTAETDSEWKSFRWTTAEKARLVVGLPKDDYQIKIQKFSGVPLSLLDWDSQKVTIFLNGEKLDSRVETDKNSAKDWMIEVPAEQIKEGRNVITFSAPVWTLDDEDNKDQRTLGIPICRVKFTPLDQVPEEERLDSETDDDNKGDNKDKDTDSN